MAKVRTVSLPAPVGGWNARDPLADMPETDAILLDNWFPDGATVVTRLADEEYSTTTTGTVSTLMTWKGPTTQKLFAASDGNIWDISTATATALVTSQSSDSWQSQNITTAGGSYLVAVNGTDDAQLYNGTAWATLNDSSSPAITGVATASIINVSLHAERLWLVEKDSLSAWYLPVASVGGTATEINMGAIFKQGGSLVAIGSWTVDAGAGMDDYAVFITSNGEAAVYQGIDPSSASTWSKVGTYRIGNPIGYRCLAQYAGDLIVVLKDGFWSVSRAIAADRDPSQALSYKIRNAVTAAAEEYSDNDGWEAVYFPEGPFLLFNIRRDSDAHQYVMNTTNGGWCRFTGWDAYCWAVYNNQLYYGTEDAVNKAWVPSVEDIAGVITCDAMQAYSYFGAKGRVKNFTAARPIFTVTGGISFLMDINVDYDESEPTGLLEYTSGLGTGDWDSAVWDVARWGGGSYVVTDWQTVGGFGIAGALRLKTSTSGARANWASTDIVYEIGGIY